MLQPVLDILPGRFSAALALAARQADIRELRLRAGKPALVRTAAGEARLCEKGITRGEGFLFTGEEAGLVWRKLSGNAGYTLLEGQKRGYVSLPGGHRVGLSGEAAVKEGSVGMFLHITSFCIRVAHEIKGAAARVIPLLGSPPFSTLIISPPGLGKTTLLRDLGRQYANDGYNVCYADERGELTAAREGVPALDIGLRGDALTGAPKQEAMEMLVRSMAPDILVTDEISPADMPAIRAALTSGVTLLASAHGWEPRGVLSRPGFMQKGEGVFSRYIVLGPSVGEVEGVYGPDFAPVERVKKCCL